MSNLDNPNENNELTDPDSTGEIAASATALADYLAQTDKSPIREVSVFSGMKKRKCRKPTFVFPRVPPLL